MNQTFPYAGADYYSKNFQPDQLNIVKSRLRKAEYPVHRDEAEFIYITAGDGWININGTDFIIKAGDLLLLMPYHVHALSPNQQSHLEMYRIQFSLGLLLLISTNREMYLKRIEQLDKVLPIKSTTKREREQVRFICEEVLQEKRLNQSATESLNLSLISFLSYVFNKNIPSRAQGIMDSNIQWRILQYIQVHHQSKLSLRKASLQLDLSEDKIEEILKGLTGVGFTENLNRVRIRNAIALLQFEELSTNQIGKICGYQTEAHFYKQFKKSRGITPDQFRRNSMANIDRQRIRMDAWTIYIFIQENYAKDIQMKTAIKTLNMTQKKINQLLMGTFQKTYQELLNESRLLIAGSLLLTVKKSIREIAACVGFNHVETFSRNFKKRYGVAPKQFVLSAKKAQETS
ncbi:AraC family transcriptional regulator [Amphibacillus sp. Q70]|uniref:AraC family transcriptional regulator n=1 Tax=Amphibacillus sp. Q70 TaxID=3453416 RepID=UPI003F863BD9